MEKSFCEWTEEKEKDLTQRALRKAHRERREELLLGGAADAGEDA